MMDRFLEEVVTKHKKGAQGLLLAIATVVMVISALFTFMYLNLLISVIFSQGFSMGLLYPIIMMLLMGAVAVFLFLRRDRIRTEYEYTFTNGVLDFAQVFNNKHRRPLGTMNLKNISACGMVSSGSFNRYINMPGIKRSNWFLNREAELFYLYFEKDSQKRIIIIEPSEAMINYIKQSVMPGVYQIN